MHGQKNNNKNLEIHILVILSLVCGLPLVERERMTEFSSLVFNF